MLYPDNLTAMHDSCYCTTALMCVVLNNTDRLILINVFIPYVTQVIYLGVFKFNLGVCQTNVFAKKATKTLAVHERIKWFSIFKKPVFSAKRIPFRVGLGEGRAFCVSYTFLGQYVPASIWREENKMLSTLMISVCSF